MSQAFVPYTNYTNFTIGEKFQELYNVMELYVSQNELRYTIPPRQ